MGLENRPYWRQDAQESAGGTRGVGGGGFSLGLPRPGPAIKALLVLNLAVFLLQQFWDQPAGGRTYSWMSLNLGLTVGGFWQVWRYVTFQFLHSGVGHILLNMLGLYMLGAELETSWGSRRFLKFYLSCGVSAGLAYVIIGTIFGLQRDLPIIGASGGVYGIVLAAAVLFPHYRIFIFFFPLPIRLVAMAIFGGMVFVVMQGFAGGSAERSGAMSDVAHLGGAVAAAVWIWVLPRLGGGRRFVPRVRQGLRSGAWQQRLEDQARERAEVDRILQKIHDEGVASLTRKEKDLLQEATRRQREEEERSRHL